MSKGRNDNGAADRVPVFGSWRKAYIAVVAAFVFEVAIFYAIGRYFM